MIDYKSCKQIVVVLLKKWYIVILTAAIMGAVSIPLAKWSYHRAEDSYQKYVLDEEMKYNFQGEYRLKYADPSDLKIFMACLRDEQLMSEVYGNTNSNDSNVGWEGFLERLELACSYDESKLYLYIANVTQDEIDHLLKAIFKEMPECLDEHWTFEELVTQTTAANQINDMIMKQPETIRSNSKILFSSVLLGVMLGSFIVLLRDYSSKCKNAAALNAEK